MPPNFRPKKALLSKSFTLLLSASLSLSTLPGQAGGTKHLMDKVRAEQANDKESPTTLPSLDITESKNIFSGAMNTPLTQFVWQEFQLEAFQTAPDQYITQFISENPILNQIFRIMEAKQPEMLESFRNQQEVSVQVFDIKSIPDSISKKVKTLLIETARELGFSNAAIESMILYRQKGGGANAFTVSGSPEHIIVSINQELTEQMNPTQVKAVIAHELFHIKFGHVLKGSIMDLMFAVIQESLSVKSQSSGQKNTISELLREVPWITQSNHHGSERHVRQSQRLSAWLNVSKPDLRQALHMKAFNALMNIEAKAKETLMVNFLETLNAGLVQMGDDVPIEELNGYIKSIQEDLVSPASRKPQVNNEDLIGFFKIVSNAYSRWQETSCDLGAASLVQNFEVASAMSLLVLGDKKSKALDRFKSVINSTQSYWNVLHRTATDVSERARLYIEMDHPAINKRQYLIMKFPGYPLILTANPFLRLALLEQVLRKGIENPTRALEWANFQQIFKNQQGPQLTAESIRAELTSAHRSLTKQVVQLIQKLELRLTKADATNARFDNLMQFIAGRNQALLLEARTLSGERPNATPARQDEIDSLMKELVAELNTAPPILGGTKTMYETLLVSQSLPVGTKSNIAARLNTIVEFQSLNAKQNYRVETISQADAEELAKFQERITPNRESRSRIPIGAASCREALKLRPYNFETLLKK
jgi:Zn-dependent protease with chaperone function